MRSTPLEAAAGAVVRDVLRDVGSRFPGARGLPSGTQALSRLRVRSPTASAVLDGRSMCASPGADAPASVVSSQLSGRAIQRSRFDSTHRIVIAAIALVGGTSTAGQDGGRTYLNLGWKRSGG